MNRTENSLKKKMEIFFFRMTLMISLMMSNLLANLENLFSLDPNAKQLLYSSIQSA